MHWRTAYRRAFHRHAAKTRALVERRMSMREDVPDAMDHLLAAGSQAMQDWFEDRAKLADGELSTAPVSLPRDVLELIDRARRTEGPWVVQVQRRPWDAWTLATVALLRELCALTYREITARTGCSASYRNFERHRFAVLRDATYRTRVAVLAQRVLPRGD